jgi:hypothetical protein
MNTEYANRQALQYAQIARYIRLDEEIAHGYRVTY